MVAGVRASDVRVTVKGFPLHGIRITLDAVDYQWYSRRRVLKYNWGNNRGNGFPNCFVTEESILYRFPSDVKKQLAAATRSPPRVREWESLHTEPDTLHR